MKRTKMKNDEDELNNS